MQDRGGGQTGDKRRGEQRDCSATRGRGFGSQLRRQPLPTDPGPQPQATSFQETRGASSLLDARPTRRAGAHLAASPKSTRPLPRQGSAEDAFPATSSGRSRRDSASVQGPERLENEAWQFRYLVGTLETEMAAIATALLPHNACLSATDIEPAAILLQAHTGAGGRITARDELPAFQARAIAVRPSRGGGWGAFFLIPRFRKDSEGWGEWMKRSEVHQCTFYPREV
ncbi:hypothetical protein TREES_T100005331 [Tupaia chinensis]|uniref:Uncharacterized protein n=1 Tax=Tupaia chinensis TaxID=246437 RepID=L9KSD6_TUPCH|nr:hypothetical protein TREES_T100005331 [Tupaia chinensis]